MQRLRRRLSIDRKRLIDSLLLIVFFFVGPSFSQNSDVIPPVIIEGPPTHQVYNPRGMISLPCTADGTSPLTHYWYRNGKLLDQNSSSNVQKGQDGSLNLNQPNEGYYQCRVENSAGVAVSNITFLQSAVFEEGIKTTESIFRNAFQPLLLPCDHIKRSIPAPSIRWVRWEYGEDKAVMLSDRIAYSENGSLVFTALFPNDSNPDGDEKSKYKCIAYNYMTQREIGGSYFRLKVNATDRGNQIGAPVLVDSSNDTVRVREGQQLKLSCIFGGVNMSGALWILPNKTVLSPTWQLNIPNVKTSDRGNYTCYVIGGENPKHTTEKVIKVIVDAFPRLETPLQGQRVQRGGSAHFTCRGIGQPAPKVSWIINGTMYNGTEYSSTQLIGFQYPGSIHGHSLTLHDVQSSASVACNVSNEHGYHLSSSYLIVGDNVATTSSHSQSSLAQSSADVTTRGTSPSTSINGSSSTPSSTISMPSSTGGGAAVEHSTTTISPGNDGSKAAEPRINVSESDSTDSNKSTLVPVAIGVVVVIIILFLAVIGCIVYRRRKKLHSYSLNPQDQQIGLKAEYNSRDQDPTAGDSDDSGYDDVGRKTITNLKHTKRLSDTPEETFLSHL